MPGNDGMVLTCPPGEIPDAPAIHGFHLPLVLLSNQYRRTLEPFLEHFMLTDIPLGRDATAAEVLRARTEDVSVLPFVEELKERRRKYLNYNIFQAREGVSYGVTYGIPRTLARSSFDRAFSLRGVDGGAKTPRSGFSRGSAETGPEPCEGQ